MAVCRLLQWICLFLVLSKALPLEHTVPQEGMVLVALYDFLVVRSCAERCGTGRNATWPCGCHVNCVTDGNCCPDYNKRCQGSITELELLDISSQLWVADVDRVAMDLNLQNKTKNGDTTDYATQPLCGSIPDAVTKNPVYTTQMALYDDYHPDVNVTEDMDSIWPDVDAFLTQVMATKVMKLTNNFLATKGLAYKDAGEFQNTLRSMWYDVYLRGKHNSSGAEHVQMGEQNNMTGNAIVGGFHSWLRFCSLEAANQTDYLGYVANLTISPGASVIQFPFFWDGFFKRVTSFFVGTSPAFDLAIFTLCFFARPNAICNTLLNGVLVPVQTFQHLNIGVTDRNFVATAYPNITNPNASF